jgi:outer membrane lipoprotein-sorting protein
MPAPVRLIRALRPTLTPAAVTVALGLGAAPSAIQAQDGMAILEEAAQRYEGVEAVCARFTQVLEVVLLGQENRGEGELCQARPNLFSMRFSDPPGDAVVADGEHFWIYYRSINPEQVLRLPVDPSRGGLDFYREFLEDPRSKYDATVEGEEVVTGRRTVRVALAPLSNRGYQSARVWVDPDRREIRRVEVTEENGSIRTVTLEDIRMDADVPSQTFRFDVPDGVSVVIR